MRHYSDTKFNKRLTKGFVGTALFRRASEKDIEEELGMVTPESTLLEEQFDSARAQVVDLRNKQAVKFAVVKSIFQDSFATLRPFPRGLVCNLHEGCNISVSNAFRNGSIDD